MRKNKNYINGLTLIEILAICLFMAIGVSCSKHFGNKFGIPGYILGFLGGFLATDFFFGGIPRMPYCKDNSCKGPDSYGVERIKNGTIVNKCECGGMYIRKGRKFLEIDEDGNENRYLIWIPFKGWEKDV
jgi:hypothetical protein